MPEMTRRSALKIVAASGVGLVVGGSVGAGQLDELSTMPEALSISNDEWFAQRVWSVSANRVLIPKNGADGGVTSLAKRIYRPSSADEIAEIVRSFPASTPIACVCGGHESSNAAMVASQEAVILDLNQLKAIEFTSSDEETLVKVGSGVVFRELVEAVKLQGGALPVGTGPGVGVVGYITNGGLSSYFSRRLGLLGQRVAKMTVVTAAGEICVLTPEDELFTTMLGAGSALAIVADVTLRLATANVVKGSEQRVFGFETRDQAVQYAREAMGFMREQVIPNEAVSLEIVVSGNKAIVATTTFYDNFDGDPNAFVKPLEDLASNMKLTCLAQAHWASWYEAAAALWPVIAQMRGNPLATLNHCVGTQGIPSDEVLDFVSETMVGEAPFDEAPLSILEIRTLGGAAQKGPRVPSGNCEHAFFADFITLYDAAPKSAEERKAIVDATNGVMNNARKVEGLNVDFSGTHSQPDDPTRTVVPSEIFGSVNMAAQVLSVKKKMDPENRLRFHPFARILA